MKSFKLQASLDLIVIYPYMKAHVVYTTEAPLTQKLEGEKRFMQSISTCVFKKFLIAHTLGAYIRKDSQSRVDT